MASWAEEEEKEKEKEKKETEAQSSSRATVCLPAWHPITHPHGSGVAAEGEDSVVHPFVRPSLSVHQLAIHY